MLLSRGADVNIQGGEYGTALQAAVAYGQYKIHVDETKIETVINILLAQGVNVDLEGGKYGSAIAAATKFGLSKVKRLLSEYALSLPESMPGSEPILRTVRAFLDGVKVTKKDCMPVLIFDDLGQGGFFAVARMLKTQLDRPK